MKKNMGGVKGTTLVWKFMKCLKQPIQICIKQQKRCQPYSHIVLSTMSGSTTGSIDEIAFRTYVGITHNYLLSAYHGA